MAPSSYFKQLANRCNKIAAESTDGNGFVPVRQLLEKFKAKLLVRPLLVEGMLASSEHVPNDADRDRRHQWCVLLDRETHDISADEIASERFGAPLPPRLRNTVAHELAHSFAFRPTEFGVEFPKRFGSDKTREEFVQLIEKETEKLSPLLIFGEALLDRVFRADAKSVSARDLCAVIRSAGVSRYVFVNRLNLLELVDTKRLRSRSSLTNVAVGIGEWVSSREAHFKDWPLYFNFEGGKVPGFLFQLQRGVPVHAQTVFPDPGFSLCGGLVDQIECIVPAGTPRNPSTLKLPIRCSVEGGRRTPGSEFLFLIQSLEIPT